MEPHEPQYKKIYVEWWKIRRSTITAIIGFLVVSAIVGIFAWLAMRNNWFSQENVIQAPKNAATILSFEGDVRIIRAATRETVVVTKETFVAAGRYDPDPVRRQGDRADDRRLCSDGSAQQHANHQRQFVDLRRSERSRFARRRTVERSYRPASRPMPRTSSKCPIRKPAIKSQTDASFNADAQTTAARSGSPAVASTRRSAVPRRRFNENEFASVNDGRHHVEGTTAPLAETRAACRWCADSRDSGAGVGVTFAWQDASTTADLRLLHSGFPLADLRRRFDPGRSQFAHSA